VQEYQAEELGGSLGDKILREAKAQQAELDREDGGPLVTQLAQPLQVPC
jgi:hypothetical protein